MPLRRRENPVISPPPTDPDIWPDDDILAPNSDTEAEPLVKRRKHIDQIAQFCRDGGELVLISTTLRGPIIQNPWKRRPPPPSEKESRRGGLKDAGERLGKRKRKTTKVAVAAAKDGKVDRYFVAQKNSQERDVAVKKQGSEVESRIVDKENAMITEKSSQQKVLEGRVPEFKAVPRVIDFDMVPQSTDIPSQHYPSLQLIAPVHEPAQQISPRLDDSNTLRPENAIIHSDGEVELFDAPTPEKPTSPKKTAPEATARELESIQNLIGAESTPKTPSSNDPDQGLYDDPTPQPICTESPPPPPPVAKHTPPDSFPRILPSSLTNRPSRQSFSPINPIGPLELSRLDEMKSLQTSSTHRHNRPPPFKRRRSSSVTLLPVASRPILQRSHSHQQTTPQNPSPPLNTQSMYDLANQSFNAIVQQPKQPTTPLLPAATFTSSKPCTPRPAQLFTPFRVLNTSPVHDEEEVGRLSFKLGDGGESPLTYSPLVRGEGRELWGDMKGFMGTWTLEEEVEKYKALGKGGEASAESQSQSQSQGCVARA